MGPDLTGTNRVNANWLLLNVLEPNADVQDAYKMTVVTTRDGRTYSGSIAAETDRQLTLRVVASWAPWPPIKGAAPWSSTRQTFSRGKRQPYR